MLDCRIIGMDPLEVVNSRFAVADCIKLFTKRFGDEDVELFQMP